MSLVLGTCEQLAGNRKNPLCLLWEREKTLPAARVYKDCSSNIPYQLVILKTHSGTVTQGCTAWQVGSESLSWLLLLCYHRGTHHAAIGAGTVPWQADHLAGPWVQISLGPGELSMLSLPPHRAGHGQGFSAALLEATGCQLDWRALLSYYKKTCGQKWSTSTLPSQRLLRGPDNAWQAPPVALRWCLVIQTGKTGHTQTDSQVWAQLQKQSVQYIMTHQCSKILYNHWEWGSRNTYRHGFMIPCWTKSRQYIMISLYVCPCV